MAVDQRRLLFREEVRARRKSRSSARHSDAALRTADPVGQIIRIQKRAFMVTGLSGEGMSLMGNDQDDVRSCPTHRHEAPDRGHKLRSINVQAQIADDIPQVQQQINACSAKRHALLLVRR